VCSACVTPPATDRPIVVYEAETEVDALTNEAMAGVYLPELFHDLGKAEVTCSRHPLTLLHSRPAAARGVGHFTALVHAADGTRTSAPLVNHVDQRPLPLRFASPGALLRRHRDLAAAAGGGGGDQADPADPVDPADPADLEAQLGALRRHLDVDTSWRGVALATAPAAPWLLREAATMSATYVARLRDGTVHAAFAAATAASAAQDTDDAMGDAAVN
jgi:hypothetical protein